MRAYSVHLIDSAGNGSYLSVRGRTSWKTKRTAIRHADAIRGCKNMPWNIAAVDVENEFGEVVT
jgi:hypothetical protein